jgi:hypothetical protein
MNLHLDVRVLASRSIHASSAFGVLLESLRLPSGLELSALVVDQPRGAVPVAARPPCRRLDQPRLVHAGARPVHRACDSLPG